MKKLSWSCGGCGTTMGPEEVCGEPDEWDLEETFCDDCESKRQDIEHDLNDPKIFTSMHREDLLDEGDGIAWQLTPAGEKLLDKMLGEAFELFTLDDMRFWRAVGIREF